MTRERIKNSFQEDLHSLCEAGNPPTTLLLGDDLPKKIRDDKKSSKFTSYPVSTATIHRTSTPECGQPRATNTEFYIAHNTRTPENTGINKHSKYKALRHTIDQGILQIQE